MAGKKDKGKTRDELLAEVRQPGVAAEVESRLFRNLVDQVSDAIFIIDPETGRFLDVNSKACSNLGYGLEELRKMCVWDVEALIPDILSWKARVNEVRNREKAVREGRQRRKDGTAFPVEINASYIPTEERDYFVAVVRDITERKRVEESLKEQKMFAESLIENSAVATFVLNPQHEVVSWNKACEELTGIPSSEMIGTQDQWRPFYTRKRQVLADIIIDGNFGDMPALYSAYAQPPLLKNGLHSEGWYPNLNGRERYIIFDAAPIYNTGGELTVVIETLQDITERKKLEEQLSQITREWEETFNTITDMVTVHDKNYNIIRANKAAGKILGLPFLEGEKVKCFDYYHGTACPPEGCPSCLTLATGKAITSEMYEPHLKMFIEISTNPRFDSNGNIEGLIHVVRDISERKKAEDELKLFRNLIDQANDAIFVVDPETGRFLDVNAKACKNLGYAREELLTKAVSDVDDVVVPDTFSWKAHVDEVRNRGHVVVGGRHIGKGGTAYPVEVNVTYISLEKREYMVAVARDITERKRAGEELQRIEKKYKDLFDSTLDGIYQIDGDGVFILMNPSGARIFGYESPDEIIGRRGLEYWRDHGDREIFREELRIKKSVSGYPMRLKKKNGEPIELETSSTVIEDEKGHFLGMEGILRDVTERRKLEDQLRQAQKMEAVGQLAGGIAHDFNNILTAIIGYGHLLHMKMDGNDPLRINVEQILEAGDRAASLTQNLLAFSRKQIINPRPASLNEIMMKVEKLLLRIIGEDIELRTKFGGGGLTINVDVGQIEQAMINLATNARDAMPGGGSLSIETELSVMDDEFKKAHGFGEPGKYALISVTDTGTGMSKETKDKIFEPFFTTKEVGKGTGLGLAMVYGIVKQHNGYITVYSEPGEGTIFKIYLPLAAAKAEGRKEALIATVPAGGTETILVAEDDPALRELNALVLADFGYNVITAEDGEEAVQRFMENSDRINFCLLDMIMPKLGGKEVYERIRETKPGIKVLFASGYAADKTHMEKLLKEGLDYIQKPVSPGDLLKKIREILDREATGKTLTISSGNQ